MKFLQNSPSITKLRYRFHQSVAGTIYFATLLFALSGPVAASEYEYISAGDTWKYVCANPSTSCPNHEGFQASDYDDSGWSVGTAPFSNVTSGDFAANTDWTAGYWPVVRHTFDLGTAVDMTAYIGLDNGYDMYVNGVLVSTQYAEGFTTRWEYIVPISSSYFRTGSNVVALQLYDNGVLTAFDMRLVGDDSGRVSVPEPGSLALFGSGLLALYAGRRRKPN